MKLEKLKAEFSERLGTAMINKGFRSPKNSNKANTQKLADAAQVSRQMAAKYLNGVALPDSSTLHDIAEWLDCDPWWLLYGKKKTSSPQTSSKIDMDVFRYLSSNLRSLIMQQAKLGVENFSLLMDSLVDLYNNLTEIDGGLDAKKKAADTMLGFIKSQYKNDRLIAQG